MIWDAKSSFLFRPSVPFHQNALCRSIPTHLYTKLVDHHNTRPLATTHCDLIRQHRLQTRLPTKQNLSPRHLNQPHQNMSTKPPPTPSSSLSRPSTFRQHLAANTFVLPIVLLILLVAFNKWISSYDLAFPMRVWLWTTNVGVVMVGVGMFGARIAGEGAKAKEG